MLLTLILTLTLSHFLTLSLSQSLTLSHSHTLSISHWITLDMHAEQLLFSSLCSKVTLTLSRSHSHTLSLSHSHTLSISHSITLDMLNKFCFHVKAQKSLFIAENCNAFFLTAATTASCEFRVHRAGSQLKMKNALGLISGPNTPLYNDESLYLQKLSTRLTCFLLVTRWFI